MGIFGALGGAMGLGAFARGGNPDQSYTERQGDWDVTSGGFAGHMTRQNPQTGEQQYFDKRSGQWVSGSLFQQAPQGSAPDHWGTAPPEMATVGAPALPQPPGYQDALQKNPGVDPNTGQPWAYHTQQDFGAQPWRPDGGVPGVKEPAWKGPPPAGPYDPSAMMTQPGAPRGVPYGGMLPLGFFGQGPAGWGGYRGGMGGATGSAYRGSGSGGYWR